MVVRTVHRLCVRRSCGLQQAEGKGVHFVRYSFGFDFTVHHDAAANTVTIALCDDTSRDCRLGDRELQRPRQACYLNYLRLSLDVEIDDFGHGAWGVAGFV